IPEKDRRCATCGIDVSPKWWKTDKIASHKSTGSQDVHMVNGFKTEPTSSRESPMRVEALLSNGVTPPHVDRHREILAVTTSTSTVQPNSRHVPTVAGDECHKCHFRRL